MSDIAKISEHKGKKGLVATFAEKYTVEPEKLLNTLKRTAFKQQGNKEVTNEQMMALLVVANTYDLNPFTREIYAFPQSGGVVPIVPVDGWMKIINSHPNFDGMTFKDQLNDKGQIVAITCSMYRKDRAHPVEVTEYMAECSRNTDPWKKWPARMLRHKAAIQAARYAFSFSGIYDPDEGDRINESGTTETEPELKEFTPDQKKYYDQLIEQSDALGMYVFEQSVRKDNESIWAALYHSFPKGQKGKYQKIVNELTQKGANEFADIQAALVHYAQQNDDAGIQETFAELDSGATDAMLESLDMETYQIVNEVLNGNAAN